jgi:hypothetical protein
MFLCFACLEDQSFTSTNVAKANMHFKEDCVEGKLGVNGSAGHLMYSLKKARLDVLEHVMSITSHGLPTNLKLRMRDFVDEYEFFDARELVGTQGKTIELKVKYDELVGQCNLASY